ncbi:GNAT family N-acetyltransferase [Rubrivirga sp. S365]|uniref:GNAT family N-acetyltransferase n=1 Tax=Rubrivirga litoralis TaxID=3075598 RepID=A0ABU3BMT3_9BACT|nr:MULTISPECIES: GNAT family N-acetyltransferase [unclassified Rubrivirga]MDT0630589.1 GNAT family N-acetyltransferase [Rubrivirga sp. F394]MDT7857699.1 GNAT family N-acetyltransferase [Rubrivirga sp. S365]
MSVRLEPLALRHAAAYQALAADARVAATTLVPHPYPPDGAVRHVRCAVGARDRDEAYSFAVIEGGNGQAGGVETVVGSCSLKHVDREAGQAEVGYWIGVPFWGRGYATEAVRLAARVAFDELGLDRVVAEVLETNPASARVLEKAGFDVVGRFANPHARYLGAPTVLYDLARPAHVRLARTD